MTTSIDMLLINPINRKNPPAFLPYGLLFIAGFLRENGYEVKIYDRNADKTDVRDILKKFEPKSIGISCLTGPLINDAIFVSKSVKKDMPNTPVIWGGLHPTLFPEQVIEKDYIDIVVVGEGEITSFDLLKKIENKDKYSEIKGIVYKKNGHIKYTEPRELINDLDDMPFPAWDLVDMSQYYQKRVYADKVLTINTSRGCPFRCTFCYNETVNKRKWRGQSAQRIYEEIEILKSQYKINGIHFYEDDFDADKKRVEEFCNLLLKEKIDLRWHTFSRVNYATKDRLELQKKAGCVFVEYGVESGSPRILEFVKKDSTVQMIKDAFKKCQEIGMSTSALFMIGLPTETIEDVNATIRLLKSLDAQQYVCSIYKPYPGTTLYKFCIDNGLLKPPTKLEDYGTDIYDYGCLASKYNMSKVPTDYLLKVNKMFFTTNIINEIKFCFKYRNFGLLKEDIVNHFNIEYIKDAIKGLR